MVTSVELVEQTSHPACNSSNESESPEAPTPALKDCDPPLSLLGETAIAVLRLMALGHRVRDIAETLDLSEKTVESCRYRMSKKLNIHGSVRLCRYAIRQGLIQA